ncbi:rr1 [Hyposidra talaca nucleopolyhedrovirus]|uniref:Ribonucleoside-diphosphate reductase n=1 Tax=Hyposidra talaca nucleopolyhedrovirus TaxID=1070315 RepID=A0A2Z4HIA2_9ABAC|nr:rr1 [Hyposidra talaca nucleopolyhedrovirus]AWW14501.1 rr1 [Hyposidra talaca nucleopolyhedrovirus]
MILIKRNGDRVPIDQNRIAAKLHRLAFKVIEDQPLNRDYINVHAISKQVVRLIRSGVTADEMEVHMAQQVANLAYIHSDYAALAGRILTDNLHKHVEANFATVAERMYRAQIISQTLYETAQEHAILIEQKIDYKRDYTYKYFGFKTLENSYLKKIDGLPVERIQHMLMRVSLGIHGRDLASALKTYDMMSRHMFTHASPTLFAAGTPMPQLSSCFLFTIQEDSIKGIYDTLCDCAIISKYGGGIGVNVHDVRARGSRIRSTNGSASGLESMLRVYNNTVRHVDQGGKRKGAMAVYVEPWHADIYDFLNLKRNMGSEDRKARDLLYALWVPDLFMKRIESDGKWSLMCPDACSGLSNVYGDQFETLYVEYESRGKFVRQVNARDLFKFIVETQVETGTPYMLYKDACNRKSNQRNLGTIKCSNLCAEIVEYSDADEIAVCNLASICVNRCVANNQFDFHQLKKITKTVVRNLNKIIDVNYYPLEKTRASNLRHRPIGVGVQGLADAFVMLRLPYESDDARLLNKQIAETIYYGALEASCELAAVDGVYASYANSPASQGVLQYDMWNVKPTDLWDWKTLKLRIKEHGLRNSLLVAYMPTATTAQILGNNESFEPFTNNLYVRRVLAGDFPVINQYLIDDLISLDMYNETMRNRIIAANGSIQNIEEIPHEVRNLYKTVWEMKCKTLIEMSVDRAAFIDQSQSFNIFVANPTFALMTSIHMYAWKKGLKTGMYYLRTKPAADAIKFTLPKMITCNSCSA